MANAGAWSRRAALVYTVGTWTLFGWVALQSFSFLTRAEKFEKKEEEDQQPSSQPDKLEFGTIASEDSVTETTKYGTPGTGFNVSTTVRYKPDFVPYTTRLYNYIQSFLDNGAKKEK